MINLPEQFQINMKELLQDEYDDYFDSFSNDRVYGLRINTNKISVNDFLKINPFNLRPIPWTDDGFYFDDNDKPSKHPYYYAGLYYIQEPSAMTPVTWLEPEPDDIVLDLCAAPGGKSTQIATKLTGKGYLVTNDPSASRCKALLKNIELAGIGNAVITCANPKELESVYPSFFDKILVDAPCSGEGMFRKDRAVLNAYKEHGPSYFAPIQKSVLSSAVSMLKPGGTLVYSTCTFSVTEDEDNVKWLIENNPEMKLEKMIKLLPHLIKGEGHFVAKFKKL